MACRDCLRAIEENCLLQLLRLCLLQFSDDVKNEDIAQRNVDINFRSFHSFVRFRKSKNINKTKQTRRKKLMWNSVYKSIL